MLTLIFACVHNAGRSQMAAAFFNALADGKRVRALSAGTRPADSIHARVVEAMREVGLDLSGMTPQRLTPELASGAQRIVTMGCGEECPLVPGVQMEDWPLADPAGQSLDQVRMIRDEIRLRVEDLLRSEGWARSA